MYVFSVSKAIYWKWNLFERGYCTMIYSKEIVREWLDEVAERAKDHPEWVDVFERCYTDTLDNTVEILEDGSTFVLQEIFLLCGFETRQPNSDPTCMWLKEMTSCVRPLQVWLNVRWPWFSRIHMPTLLTLRKTGRGTTRLTTQTLMAGFGNASMRWTRFAIRCSWLISSGKRLARLVSLMRLCRSD